MVECDASVTDEELFFYSQKSTVEVVYDFYKKAV